ncbi:conjugal transfer protein TraI [Bacteroides clarus]|uniref:conjugal transfer protein TraI n=1 Tax=Bacteroides clarus TaxID=626929 RepID=UPI0021010E9D|nr:conjugal transfer protein TraI [Bacteroides clarus]MCQ1544380.1 conjugal transfer protein TraI [Bacteroides clarus]
MSRFHNRNFELLEPYDAKVSCTVLRGESIRKDADLLDKKYYDALKSVNNLVKDARKVQQTILMVGDITDTYVTSFQKMMRDDNFTVEELGAIAFGYTKLLEESNDVLTELKNVVNITTLSMTDKERMDVVERCYSKMKRYRNLVSYYTNKNISVSYLRAKKKNDLDRIMGLYGNMNERYW